MCRRKPGPIAFLCLLVRNIKLESHTTRCICPGVKTMTQLEHWKTSFLPMFGVECFLHFLSNIYCHWHLCHLSDCYTNSLVSYCKLCYFWDENQCQMTKPLSLLDSCDTRCPSYAPDAAGNLLDLWLRHLPLGFKSHIMIGIYKTGYPHLRQGDGEPANTAAWPHQRSEQRHPGWPAWWEGEYLGFLCWDFYFLVCSWS